MLPEINSFKKKCSHSSLKTISSSLEVIGPGMLSEHEDNPCYRVAHSRPFGKTGLSLDSEGHQRKTSS